MTVCFWKLQLLIFKLIKNQEMILENCRGSYNTIPQPEAMYGQDGPGLVHILVHGLPSLLLRIITITNNLVIIIIVTTNITIV